MITGVAVGSTTVRVVNNSPAITVSHFYYSSLAGRRPMIPLRVGTTVSFTAPSDTSVKVYTRLNKDLPATEVLIATLTPNQAFSRTFNTEHVVIFEYANNSTDDRVATINYPQFDGSATGIRIESYGVSGEFGVGTTSGDLAGFVTAVSDIQLPVFSVNPIEQSVDRSIKAGSVKFLNQNNAVQYIVADDGTITLPNGADAKGKLDYTTGILSLPEGIANGDYRIIYNQDDFENFKLSDLSAPILIEPKQSFSDITETLSVINIRK
jgi:hypothetical protein